MRLFCKFSYFNTSNVKVLPEQVKRKVEYLGYFNTSNVKVLPMEVRATRTA